MEHFEVKDIYHNFALEILQDAKRLTWKSRYNN